MAPLHSGVPDDVWDSELRHVGGHFLQSRAWQLVQERLGYRVLGERGDGWLWAGAVRSGRFPRYLYVPCGPAGMAVEEALPTIVRAGRGLGLDFARIEPQVAPRGSALRRIRAIASTPVQPRWTWVLDLALGEDALLRGMSAGHRGSINAATRRGLSLRRSADERDVDSFVDLQRRSAGAGRHRGHPAAYYRALVECLVPRQSAALYFAEAQGHDVAAAIVFDFGATRYYAHAVSDPDLGRRLGAAAPLVWWMILDARAEGKREFDFWGVAPPESEDHRWAGFTQFKRAFGGRIVERPGTWEIPLRIARHRLYSLLRSVRT